MNKHIFYDKQYIQAKENMKNLPPCDFLNECFELRKDGFLYWKKRPIEHFKNKEDALLFNEKWAGTLAGSNRTKRRYINLSFDNVYYSFLARHIVIKMLTINNPIGILEE